MGLTKISGERMYGKLLLILIPFLFLNSCEYVPTAVNHKDIELTDPGIDLTVLNENEINVLRGIAHLSFNADLNGNKLYDVALYLDDRQVGHSYDPSSTINFDTRVYDDGNYVLTFVLSASTNSGSLADIIGAEAYVLMKQYQVELFNASVTPPGITDMFVENGALHVKWTKFEGPGFQKYVLSNGYHDARIITDPDSTECIDYAYTGGYILRRINTYFAGTSLQSAQQTFTQYAVQEFTSAEINSDNQIVLKWNRSIFDSAFSYYKIYAHGDSAAVITDINDTTYAVTDPVFGVENTCGLKVVPKAGEYFYPFYSELRAPQTGQPFTYLTSAFFDYIPAMNKYFVYDNTRIFSYDEDLNQTAQNQIQTSYWSGEVYGTDMSSDGQLFYIVTDPIGAIISKVNPSSLQIEGTYNLEDISGMNLERVYGISVSDNNLLAVVTQHPNGDSCINHIFNLSTEQLIASNTVHRAPDPYGIQISKDGKYVRSQESLFKLENGILSFTGSVSQYARFLEDPAYLVDYSDSKVKILTCANLQVQKEMTFTENLSQASLDVDKKDGYIGLELPISSYYYILDMQSGTIKKKIPIFDHYYCFTNMGIFGNLRAMFIHF